MNATHIHLIITHLPIFGSILGSIVLSYGLATKSTYTQNASYLVFIISAVGAGIAYLTGEAAEETVEHIQGVVHDVIESHEESAKLALISMGILAVFSVVSLYFNYRKERFAHTLALITLILSLISFGFSAYTGYLGGKIRHTEIYNSQLPVSTSEDDD